MRYGKFRRFCNKAPWILSHVGTPSVAAAHLNYSRGEAERIIRKWVDRHLRFIAFKPFEALDLNTRNTTTGTREEWATTSFCVRLHIVGVDDPFQRMRYVVDKVEEGNDETTVLRVLSHLQNWHQKYWAGQGRDLSIDAIVKQTRAGSRRKGLRYQSLEIFPVPKGFRV